MEFKKCFQCNNDLPFSTSTDTTKCPFCGAVNEPLSSQKFDNGSDIKRNVHRRSDDAFIIGPIIGGESCDSDLGGGGDC